MHKVFVYGTLKKGQRNHGVLQKRPHRFLGEAVTLSANYVLSEFDSWSSHGRKTPALHAAAKAQSGQCVLGELYEVNDDGLAFLDELEQVGKHYTREDITLSLEGDTAQAWIYLKLGDKGETEKAHFIKYNNLKKAWYWSEF